MPMKSAFVGAMLFVSVGNCQAEDSAPITEINSLPEVEISGKASECRALAREWEDAIVVAYEAWGPSKHGGALAMRFERSRERANLVGRRAVGLKCPNWINSCGYADEYYDAIVDDLDTYESLRARGVSDAFLSQVLNGQQDAILACQGKRSRVGRQLPDRAPGEQWPR